MRMGMRVEFVVVTLVIALLAGLGACGDDDDGGASTDAGAAGTNGGSGSGGGSSSGRIPLGDGVAGKACANNAECGSSGTCAMQLAGIGLATQPLPAPGGYCTAACSSDADCGTGGACIGAIPNLTEGQCFATCTDGASCREGYACGGGVSFGGITVPDTCRPVPETDQLADGVAGDMCASDEDCSGGRCLTMRTTLTGGSLMLPGGYCSGACLEDVHCGEGGVCLPALLGGAGSCYQDCASDADCTRDGYRCRPLRGGIRGCNPAPDPLPDNTVGNACTSDADCGGGMDTCASGLPASGLAGLFGDEILAPGGYCSQACVEDIDCGAGGACASGTCFKRCSSESDCRMGYLCEGRGGGAGAQDAGTGALQVCAPVEPMDEEDAGAG